MDLRDPLNTVVRCVHTKFCFEVEDHWERETWFRASTFAGAESSRNGMDLLSLSLDVAPYFSCSQHSGGHMAEAVAFWVRGFLAQQNDGGRHNSVLDC